MACNTFRDDLRNNYFGHVVNRIQNNVRDQWASAKKWWYSKVVLQQYDLPQFPDLSVPNKSTHGGNVDFDYNWPKPDTYAYVW